MTNQNINDAAAAAMPDDWTALKSWFEENVLDDAPLSAAFQAQIAAKPAIKNSGQLDESAVLYKWCPTRKRLVPK